LFTLDLNFLSPRKSENSIGINAHLTTPELEVGGVS
jgi:hypothetical protein